MWAAEGGKILCVSLGLFVGLLKKCKHAPDSADQQDFNAAKAVEESGKRRLAYKSGEVIQSQRPAEDG